MLLLFDASDGSVLAVIEAFALGQLRTAGISAVATGRLARTDAREMTIVGSGKQALPQVAAVLAVRDIRRVRVFSPTPANRAALVAKLTATFPGVEVVDADSAQAAFEGTDVITLATRATSPVLSVAATPAGAHVNAVGAIVPERAEFDPQLLARCAVVSADSVPQTQTLSREFREFYGAASGAGMERRRPLEPSRRIEREPPAGRRRHPLQSYGYGHLGSRARHRGPRTRPQTRPRPRDPAANQRSDPLSLHRQSVGIPWQTRSSSSTARAQRRHRSLSGRR